ncbi:MAG: lasso peptide biosynthesis B2 protein [Proteobacteria bacterium]|nr:lasso peptide biosynthesis B2 protein [Pseudomonadota bacterium]
MGRRLHRWRALDARDRWRLVGCVIGLWCVHASLAVFGYGRTRAMIERCSKRANPRRSTDAEIADAQSLARLAASAGHNTMGEATCLRRALLLYGWLRRKSLEPALHLGLPVDAQPGTLRAHAWVELGGTPLLESDAGYRPFERPSTAAQA